MFSSRNYNRYTKAQSEGYLENPVVFLSALNGISSAWHLANTSFTTASAMSCIDKVVLN
jgi:hypothetical protein